MNKKLKCFLAVMLVFVISVSTLVFADVGNINRYDSGSSSHSSGSSSGGSLWSVLVVVIIGIVVLYFYGKSKGKIQSIKDITDINKMAEVYNDFKASTQGMVANSKEIGEEIRKEDAEFSEEKFLSWSRDVFLKIQQAWSKREWGIIRPFESNELFEQHQAQLQEYIDNNKINVIERVAINFAELAEHKVDGDKEILVVNLVAVMKDYIIDAETKKVLEGDKNTDYTMKYKMTFARKYGVKTKEGTSNKSTTNCPNCGAPTQVTSAGQCEYCGSIITTGEHDWVLTNIEGIK